MNTESKTKNIFSFLRGMLYFEALSDDEVTLIASNSRFECIKSGALIFQEGNQSRYGYIVSTGKIVLKKTTFQNKSVVTELLGPRDPFAIVAVAQSVPYPLSAQAITESVVLKIDGSVLSELRVENPKFQHTLLGKITDRLKNTQQLVARLADASSEVRVIAAMVIFADKFPESDSPSRINITRKELATLAAVTVETCIRVTKQLERDSILSFPSSGSIELLNKEELRTRCQL